MTIIGSARRRIASFTDDARSSQGAVTAYAFLAVGRGKRAVVNGRKPFVEEALVGSQAGGSGSAKARVCISAYAVATLFLFSVQSVE